MTVILDPYVLPEKGAVDLTIQRSFVIAVTAEEARRQVDRWLLTEVSVMMRALVPTLVVGEQVIWRVPVSLGMPHLGQVGTVGAVEVAVETGVMNTTPACKAEINQCAEKLAARLPSYQPRSETPAEYVAKDIPPAPKLMIPEDEQAPLVICEE